MNAFTALCDEYSAAARVRELSLPTTAMRWTAGLLAMIESHDLMDCAEVAERLGVSMSSIQVALAAPERFPSLAAKLPAPFRKIGRSWVWRRTDIENALKLTDSR